MEGKRDTFHFEAVRVCACIQDIRVNPFGDTFPLKQNGDNGFGSAVAVRSRIHALGSSVGRDHSQLVEADCQ